MALGGQDIESMVAEPSAKATNSKLGLDAGSLSPCDEMTLSLTGLDHGFDDASGGPNRERYSGVQMNTKSTMVLVRVLTSWEEEVHDDDERPPVSGEISAPDSRRPRPEPARIEVPVNRSTEILGGRRPVTADTALRLGRPVQPAPGLDSGG